MSASRYDIDASPFLANLRRSTNDVLLANATLLHVGGGEELLKEGQLASHLLFSLDESVELYARNKNRSTTIVLNPAGRPFILAAVVRNEVCLMSARTISETRVLFVPAVRFRELLLIDTELAVGTAQELSRAFRTMVRQVRWQKLRSAQARLATYLYQECGKSSGPAEIVLKIPKRLLASMLGLEPESLSRSFAGLASSGVHVNGDVISIEDAGLLHKVAIYDDVIDEPEP